MTGSRITRTSEVLLHISGNATNQACGIGLVSTSSFLATNPANEPVTSGLLFAREEHINSSMTFIESRLRKADHSSESKPVKIVFRPISEWSEMFQCAVGKFMRRSRA